MQPWFLKVAVLAQSESPEVLARRAVVLQFCHKNVISDGYIAGIDWMQSLFLLFGPGRIADEQV